MVVIEAELLASSSGEEKGGRARILREARSLFSAQGFAAVSMQQIADAAGVNKATLYHHFRDKEDLFVSVMAAEFARVTAGLGEAIAAGGTLREQLRRAAASILAERRSDFGRLTADLRDRVSEQRRLELQERLGPPWRQLEAAIASAVRAGEVRDVDPELVARAFFAMVGSQSWWTKFDANRRETDERLAETLADLLMEGIGLPREACRNDPGASRESRL